MSKPKRTYSSQFKVNLVMQYLKGSKTQAELCRENNINANLLNKWRSQFNQDAVIIFEKSKEKEYQQKVEKLQNIIGKQAIEIDFLKTGLLRTFH